MSYRYMNHKRAAKYLGIKESALYKLVQRRMVPCGKRGSKLVYDKHMLDLWMDECHKKGGVTLEEAIENYLKKGAWL